MNDEQASGEPPTAADVEQAYQACERSKTAYLETLVRYVAVQPREADLLFAEFAQETETLRVLHALSVGYGWSDAIYEVCTRAQVAQVQLRGLITRDELHGGLVLTHAGVELLRRWTDYIVPLTEKHPRYRELWRTVTSLDG